MTENTLFLPFYARCSHEAFYMEKEVENNTIGLVLYIEIYKKEEPSL